MKKAIFLVSLFIILSISTVALAATMCPTCGEGVLIRENYYTDTVETTAYCRICLHYDPAHYYIYYWRTVCDYCGAVQSTWTTKSSVYIDHVDEY